MRSSRFALALVLAALAQSSGRTAEVAIDTSAPISRAGSFASVETTVPAGADLQNYINRARPGDVLMLEPGATYVGNFTLPALPDPAVGHSGAIHYDSIGSRSLKLPNGRAGHA